MKYMNPMRYKNGDWIIYIKIIILSNICSQFNIVWKDE